VAQLTPFATLVHVVVETEGWQFSQEFSGFTAPLA
jgi:hypothetical protein